MHGLRTDRIPSDPVCCSRVSRDARARTLQARRKGRSSWSGVGLCSLFVIAAAAPTLLTAQAPASVQTRIDLEVRLYQEFMPEFPEFDGGHWTVSYRQSGPWVLGRDETSAETGIRVIRGLLAGGRGFPSVSEVVGSAHEVCMDGNADRWRTDYEPPLQVDPGMLTATSDGDQVHLWYSVPIVEMYHPGHGHIPSLSECHTMDPGRTELWFFTSDLEAAGARTNQYGEFLVATVPWADLVAVSEGRRGPISVNTDLRGVGISFEVRGTIGPPESGD
jgi:hypothetical protein